MEPAMLRLATFNVENLYTKFRFARGVDPRLAAEQGFTTEMLRERIADTDAKILTADLIDLLDADVLVLQEVEGMATLKQFRDRYLGGRNAYPYVVVLEGNDSRGIEVGVLSRLPVTHIRSWQHMVDPASHHPVFNRDCLEVDVHHPDHGTLTLYANHLKSMRDGEADGGRARTRWIRQQQCRAVMEVVQTRFGPDAGDHPFVVLGDFNDYLETDEQGETGIADLVRWPQVVNVVERLPPDERWTHFWKGQPDRELQPTYQQLDFILPSRRVALANPWPPRIERRGQPGRAQRYEGARLPGVGWDRPKASDHCPVVLDLSGW
jgi:endonuclease/exonuclease/phosphatase family metal-dependent hydrolase